MAVSLLTEDNVCKGALFLSEEGSTEVRSKVVILGTGGAGQLFAQSLNPADVTGDGYALGYRAGAELVNMEFMQAGFGVIKPARTIFNAWIWALAPRIYDEDNIDFIGEYLPPGISVDDCIRAKENHYPFSSRDESKHLEISVKKRGNMGKKIFADLRHITAASISNNINLDQMWPITKNWMLACGVDVEAAPVQITVYAHAINGGLLINANGETTVSHLYAVGETAGGPHGADRLGGNMFASSQVFGEIAGRHAAETAMALEMETSPSQSEFPLQSEYPLQSGAALPDMQSLVNVRKRLQELASDELLIVRSARGLKRFLSEIETIDGELGGAPSDLRMRAYWFETKNLFLIGRLIGQSALFRTESRGSHYREDFPKMNSGSPEGGDEWGCALIHKIQDNKTVLKKQNL
jgi:L-aspartate oxidase